MLDYERSLEIATTMNSVPKFCFYNSVKALRKRSLNLHNAKYVEGCAKGEIMAFQHGWLELEDGTILDPTFAAICLDRQYEGLDAPNEYKYFPLFRYCKEELNGMRLNRFPLEIEALGKQQTQLLRRSGDE